MTWRFHPERGDWLCTECGVGHGFLPETSQEVIDDFLSKHEHGDNRLPPDMPREVRELTEAQRRDAAMPQDVRTVGPSEQAFLQREQA